MWVELFLCLLLAHLVGDFVFQTTASCKSKADKHWRSGHQYLHCRAGGDNGDGSDKVTTIMSITYEQSGAKFN